MSNYVTIPQAAQQTGLSEKAIRRKIEDGIWLEGRQFMRAPDGRIYVSIKGFEAWVEQKASMSARAASASRSPGRAGSTGQRSPLAVSH